MPYTSGPVSRDRELTAGTALPHDELAALRARLEAVNLRGLTEAVDAWLGEAPDQVSHVLAVFQAQAHGDLPRMTSWCWSALAPLALALPPGPAPRTLDELLAGVHAEAQVALDALRDCRRRADCVPPAPALPAEDGHLVTETSQRALVAAVADFWVLLADIYTRARPVLLSQGYRETCRVLGIEQTGLHGVCERIEVLATRATGIALPPDSSDAGQPPRGEETFAAFLDEAGAAGGDRRRGSRRADRLRSIQHASSSSAAGSRRSARPLNGFRRWAPIVFLILATCVAIAILFFVLGRYR
jgi:hypothetical protein